MDFNEKKLNNTNINHANTGVMVPERYMLKKYKFGKYIIIIKLSESNEFLGIEEVEETINFMTYKDIIKSKKSFRIKEYKPE